MDHFLPEQPMWTAEQINDHCWKMVSSMLFFDNSFIQFYVFDHGDAFLITDQGVHAFWASALCEVDEYVFEQINDLQPDSLARFAEGTLQMHWVSGHSRYADKCEALKFGLQDALVMILHFSYKCRERRSRLSEENNL